MKTCTICQRSDVGEIDAALRRGATLRAVAASRGLSKSTLHVHRGHVEGLAQHAQHSAGASDGQAPLTRSTIAPDRSTALDNGSSGLDNRRTAWKEPSRKSREEQGRAEETVSLVSDTESDTPPTVARAPVQDSGACPGQNPGQLRAGRAPIEPGAARTFEERAIVCADLLLTGQWTSATPAELATAWRIDRTAIGQYHRGGRAIRDALSLDLEERRDDALGHFRRIAEQAEQTADTLEAASDHRTAVRYRKEAREARERVAEISGVVVQRVHVSLEADPRIAGLWSVLWRVLGELDAARERYLAEVERLTGGPLPGVDLPVPSAAVRAAVRAYEVEQGARSAA